ncbi:MAG: hypothetical protein LBS36_11905 [Oscillospiraceae bacterium]|nr:hypothetical protein [Oscillospiraceae bacterium]
MKKVEVMFFFDTEDFTSERSAEAILREAEICTRAGVVGHFAVVGLVAKQLKAWGRQDIIDALQPHIIGTHTYGHTLHPDICEQSDCESFTEAFQNVALYEDQGLALIKEVLEPEHILFACPPGNSKSYASMYYYADRGLPFYCDTVVHDERSTPLHYCNQEHISYFRSMEGVFFRGDADVDAFLDEIYAKKDRAIIYTHPNVAVKTEFWDELNYKKVNLRKYGDWIEAPDRDPEETRFFYEKMVELLQKLKQDERFVLTDLNEILAKRKPRTPVTKAILPVVREHLRRGLAPVRGPSFAVADIFYAVVEMLKGEEEYVPQKVYGFLSAPTGVGKACTVSAEGLRKAAHAIRTDTFIPETIAVDGKQLGPADFLMAALDVLVDDVEKAEVLPKEQLVRLEGFDELQGFQLRGTWMHSDELRDEYLSDRLRLQCWTLRYE